MPAVKLVLFCLLSLSQVLKFTRPHSLLNTPYGLFSRFQFSCVRFPCGTACVLCDYFVVCLLPFGVFLKLKSSNSVELCISSLKLKI